MLFMTTRFFMSLSMKKIIFPLHLFQESGNSSMKHTNSIHLVQQSEQD
ncbi:hypothetical protein HMPREF3038_02481 [Akkermansia sp. KLE1797]|nr:hypothetical protein HMPREF3038_02481 [Akkermansia sp. KLE1797]KXU54785.1 hypothetical protein HMPREF3039_00932 [Akkermansia sp. KLE1798]